MIQGTNIDQGYQDILSAFDFSKFLLIFRKSWIYLILILVVSVTTAYLYLRWTKPIYESSSIIQLNYESEADLLNITNPATGGEISEEIELLTSRLFFRKVAEAIDMDVSYYKHGRILNDERFMNHPFKVSFVIKNEQYNNRPIDIDIKNDREFDLSYGGIFHRHQFGEEIKTDDFTFLIEKTKSFTPSSIGGYYFTINTINAVENYLFNNVKVVPQNISAKTLRISLEDHNPIKAQYLVRVIDSVYQKYSKEAKNQALEQKIDFLQEQMDTTASIINGFDDYFENFIVKNRTTNLGDDISVTIGHLNRLDTLHYMLRKQLAEIGVIKNQLSENEPLIFNQGDMPKLPFGVLGQLNGYMDKVGEFVMKKKSYNENTLVMKQLSEELKMQKKVIERSITAYEKNLKEELSIVKSRREFLEQNLSLLPSMETDYSKKRRLYDQHEDFMLNLRSTMMEMEIARAGTVTDITILFPASLPILPIKPKKTFIYALSVVISLIIGILLLLVRYLLNNNITSLSELERLISVPVLGAVPVYVQEKLVLTKLVIEEDSKSSLSEALRIIRTNMDFMNPNGQNKVISITSTVSGEGKTFLGVNLGAIIALSGLRVCVVDADMRKPKIHLAFGDNPNANGMSTLLSGKVKLEDCLTGTKIDNLTYLSAGPSPPNPSELLLNKNFNYLIKELKTKFDLVIIDTPPVGLVTDGILVMKKADLQFYVVRAGYSKRNYVKSIDNLKKTNQFDRLTVIVNGLTISSGYGYGYGYGYEDSKEDNSIFYKLRSL